MNLIKQSNKYIICSDYLNNLWFFMDFTSKVKSTQKIVWTKNPANALWFYKGSEAEEFIYKHLKPRVCEIKRLKG